MTPRLRGFWLLSAAVGVAVLMVGATLARAAFQLGRVETFLERDGASSQSVRADEALAEWGDAWLDTWLRRRGLPADASSGLRICMVDYVYVLDEVSMGANQVRFDQTENGRQVAGSCVSAQLGHGYGDTFVDELQQRWGVFLESRTTAAGLGRGR